MAVIPNLGALTASVEETTIYASPNPADIFCYTPAVVMSPSGRLVATLDLGGPGIDAAQLGNRTNTSRRGVGKILTSDDGGRRWKERGSFPFWHARPFYTGDVLYVIGNAGDLQIIRSTDDGLSWSAPHALTEGELWHASATNFIHEGNRLYLCMERRTGLDIKGWNVAGLTPVVLRADTTGDLLLPKNWITSQGPSFQELCGDAMGDFFGVPFYPSGKKEPAKLPRGRLASPPGWLEGHVLRIVDSKHIWHDPSHATLHLLLRASTNGSGYAAILKAVEHPDGSIKIEPVRAPSETKMILVPMPGGGLKFYVAYDESSKKYWLVSSLVDDSMCRIESLPNGRFNLPSNQRNKLGLYFSSNCMDWMFAGVISAGITERHARNYPTFIFDNNDLLVASRSGDERAKDGQYTNLIKLHRVKNFRSLIY